MEGGLKENIIPDQAKLTINYRLIPAHKDPVVSKEWFTSISVKLSKKDPNFKAELTQHNVAIPLDVPLDSEIVTMLKDILRTKPVGAPYYTEAVSYSAAGIPAVICGPGSIDHAYSPDEYISLEQLGFGFKTYKELVKRTCL